MQYVTHYDFNHFFICVGHGQAIQILDEVVWEIVLRLRTDQRRLFS